LYSGLSEYSGIAKCPAEKLSNLTHCGAQRENDDKQNNYTCNG
jgi:hypothetical protein